jgi:hypothetical protein
MKKDYIKFRFLHLISFVAITATLIFVIGCKNKKKIECPPPEITSVDTQSVFQNKEFKYFKITIKTNSTACNGQLLYSIDNGREGTWQSKNEFMDVVAGTYVIAVKDVNDSVSRMQGQIVYEGYKGVVKEAPIPTKLMHAKIDAKNESCENCNNGKIVITASGGEPPYEYSIDKGKKYSASSTFSNLAPAVYNISIKDKTGKIYSHPLPVNIEKVAKMIGKISKTSIEKSLNELSSKRNFNLMDTILTWFESENIMVKGTIKAKKDFSIYRYLSRLVYDGPPGSIKVKVESLNYNDKNHINEITITEL